VFSVTFNSEIVQAIPTMRLGLLEATDVANRPHDAGLWSMLQELEESLRHTWQAKGAANHPVIAATRRAYRALRDDPTHYRPANEALLRRVFNRRAVPQVNVVVDINTFVSLQSGFPLGCYDVTTLDPPLVLRCGKPDELYTPIGKPAVDAVNRLVLVDQLGIFGSPTADSERSAVTVNTQHVLFAVFGFEGSEAEVDRALDQTATLLTRFSNAAIVGRDIIVAQPKPQPAAIER
jgi:DNA/RNA-binding domain of Phe-tRNA-synthetase-like protein